MARFKKVVARPGRYLVKTPSGKRAVRNLTKSDLAKAAKTGNEMIKDGLKIPAPYGHSDGNRLIPIPLTANPDDPASLVDADTLQPPKWDQAINAGFWTSFETNKHGELIGVLEVEGDENDPNSHAGRIGKTFVQTSPLLLGEWIDGKGRLRENAPLHICLTNKAVEPGQDNFERIEEDSPYAIAMSFSDEDLLALALDDEATPSGDDKNGKVSDPEVNPEAENPTKQDVDKIETATGPDMVTKVREELKDKLNITLPEDTTPENILERILIVLANLEPMNKEKETDFEEEPEDGQPPKAPTIMSTDHEIKKLNAGLNQLTQARKTEFKNRIENLVECRRIGRAHANDKLLPLVDAFQMSLDDLEEDGSFKKSALEMSLDLLEDPEAMAAETTLPKGGKTPEKAADMGGPDGEIDQKEVDSVLDSIFGNRVYAASPTM